MTQYFLTPTSLPTDPDTSGLLVELKAARLPATDVQTSSAHPGQVIVVCPSELTTAQSTQLTAAVTAWNPNPRVKRSIYAIYTDLVALTATQQTNIWADVSAGTPPKYLLDVGGNTAAIAALDWIVRSSGTTGAALLDAKFRAVAMYVQDNASYLVTPTFDTTINVPGDVPGL